MSIIEGYQTTSINQLELVRNEELAAPSEEELGFLADSKSLKVRLGAC